MGTNPDAISTTALLIAVANILSGATNDLGMLQALTLPKRCLQVVSDM